MAATDRSGCLDGRRLRRAEIERRMRSLPVVMSDVFAKNAAEVALVEHDQPVERRRMVLITRSQWACARG